MKRILYLLAGLLTLIVSCSKEDTFIDDEIKGIESPQTEQTSEYTVTYQYQDNVIVLGPNRLKYLEHIESDTILYFSSATPKEFLPKEGDIISAGITEKTPYGLGNIVIKRKEKNNIYCCITTSAPLNQIFKELKWNADISLLNHINTNNIYDEDGNQIELTIVPYNKESTKSTNKIDKLVQFPIKKDYKKGIGYDSKVNIGGIVHCSGDINEGTLHTYLEPIINIEATINVGLEYEKELNWTKENKMLLQKLPLVTSAIAIGPVVLRPNLDFATYFQCGASGKLEFSLGKTYSFRFGVDQQNENGWYCKDLTDKEEEIFKGVSIDGNIGCELRSYFDCRIGLYTKDVAIALLPYIKQTLTAQCRMTDAANGDFYYGASVDYDINIGAEGGLLAYLLGNPNWGIEATFTLADFNIFHHEWPLLPTYVDGSMNVISDDTGSSLLFDASYNIKGGLLSQFAKIYPGIVIYKGEEVVARKKYDELTNIFEEMQNGYTLSGLKANTQYWARPSFVYLDKHYEIHGGIPFLHAIMPQVTNINSMGKPYFERTYNGEHVVFKAKVNAEYEDPLDEDLYVPGEWGVIFYCDEQPMHTEVIAKGALINEGTANATLLIEKSQLNIDNELLTATTEGRWYVSSYVYIEESKSYVYGNKVPLELVYDQNPSMELANVRNQRTEVIPAEYRENDIDRRAWFDYDFIISGALFFDEFYCYNFDTKKASTLLIKDGVNTFSDGYRYKSTAKGTSKITSLYYEAILPDKSTISTANEVVYKKNNGKPSFSLEKRVGK